MCIRDSQEAVKDFVEAFEDIRVRQAIAHALDAAAITASAMGVLGVVADSTLPTGVDYKISVGGYEYAMEKAKSLLDEAGVKAGDLNLRCVVVNSSTNNNIAELDVYKRQLAGWGRALF